MEGARGRRCAASSNARCRSSRGCRRWGALRYSLPGGKVRTGAVVEVHERLSVAVGIALFKVGEGDALRHGNRHETALIPQKMGQPAVEQARRMLGGLEYMVNLQFLFHVPGRV